MDDYLGQFKSRKRKTQDLVAISPTGLISLPREQRLIIRVLLRESVGDGMTHADLLSATELSETALMEALGGLSAQGWITTSQEHTGEIYYRAMLRVIQRQSARSSTWDLLMDIDDNPPRRSNFSKDMEDNLRRFLPSALFERLPDVTAMTDAVQHLNRLHRAVSAYLPLYIAEGDIMSAERYTALRLGTFVFADVSGFTAMSEYLARHGSGGAETLTMVMNTYFAEMLDILAKSDGQVLKFAGDALLAFFPAKRKEDITDAHKAIRAGLRMQRAMMSVFQPIHDVVLLDLIGREHEQRLTMTAGVARGLLFETLVGNSAQSELLIQGELPGLAMEAEAVGIGNDVIIDAALAELLKNDYTLTPVGDKFMQVMDIYGDKLDDYEVELPVRRRAKSGALFDREPENLQEHMRITLEKLIPAASYLAPAVLNQLILSEDYRVAAENRYAVSMFVHVTGFAEMLNTWGASHLDEVTNLVERYFSMVQPLISARGGSFIRSDPYELGVKMLVIFGAPVAHTDDPLRAVDTALALHRQLVMLLQRERELLPEALRPGLMIEQRIGVARGEVFAGEVGWRARREYTVMGDTVNLAARLMSKSAFGMTWIDERMYERVQYRYATEPTEPLRLKGKGGLIQAYSVTAARGAQLATPDVEETFVGRSLLLLTISRALEQAAAARQRRAFLLSGEVGSGKTRVARKLAMTAQANGYAVALAHPQAGASRGVLWASVLSALLYIPADVVFEAARMTARAGLVSLGLDDDIENLLQLILEEGGVYEYDGTIATNLMSRRELAALMVRFFIAYTNRTPTLIIIDDIQQAGSDALAILRTLLLDAHEMPLVIAGTCDLTQVIDLPAERFDLSDLNEDETEQAAASYLGATELGTRLRQKIWNSSGGRPLFIEAQLRALRDADLLFQAGCVVEVRPSVTEMPLPDDVRDLISARIDQLSVEEQTVIRAASVLTDSYSSAVTVEALKEVAEMPDEALVTQIIARLDIMGLLVWGEGDSCHFHHGLVQQAIYANLTRAARLKLHRRAAEHWQRRTDSTQPFRLSYHLARVGLLPKAVEVLTDAAEGCAVDDAERAVSLYLASLELLPDQRHISAEIERLRGLYNL